MDNLKVGWLQVECVGELDDCVDLVSGVHVLMCPFAGGAIPSCFVWWATALL